MLKHKILRNKIRSRTCSANSVVQILNSIDIEANREGLIKVREENSASCKINRDGSFHDYGSGEHYSDIVSLLFDGYRAFDSLPQTMEWLCEELNINMEVYDE